MPTLAQLTAAQIAAAAELDTKRTAWNDAVASYISWRDGVLKHIYCVNPNNNTSQIVTTGMDWDSIAFTFNNYSDIGKIKSNASLPLDSGSYCNTPNYLYGDIPATVNASAALNNALVVLGKLKNLYEPLMTAYATYSNATTALTTSPEYQGEIAEQAAEGAAAGKTQTVKWIFFGVSVLIVAAVALYMVFKTTVKRRYIAFGSLGLILASYFIFFGFSKK